MLNAMKLLLPLLVLIMTACRVVPSAPVPDTTVQAPQTKPWLAALNTKAQTLPAAQLTLQESSLLIVYPGETLFSRGSVLPLAGGAEVLDPLADFLIEANKNRDCQMTVRAATADGAVYDAKLAAKRAELLQRYLHNRGMTGTCNWMPQAGEGAPLEIVVKERPGVRPE